MSTTFKHRLIEVLAALLIVLFVYTAVSKLMDFTTFRLQLDKSPYLQEMSWLMVWLVPIIEIGISILLLLPSYRRAGFYAAFFLMCLFTGYIYAILNYSDFIPCACGGVLAHLSWTQHFFFNLAFVGIALTGIVSSASRTNKIVNA